MIDTNKKRPLHCIRTRGGIAAVPLSFITQSQFAPGRTFLRFHPPGVPANAPSSLRGRKQYSFPSPRYEIPVYFTIIPTRLSSILKEKGVVAFCV